MKKNVLALSITAALVGLTGGAHAMTGALGGASATVQEFNGQGVGHSLIVPYFSTQGNNNTLINLVNTDLYNGKAVKVRFRGAANSDDIFDFQVFLSPGDVWTANIAQGADGRSRLLTNDASCTKPDKATLNSTSFITARLDQTMTAAQLANGTREGYVEIFNMADIPRAGAGAVLIVDAPAGFAAGVPQDSAAENPLFKAIKHVGKVAPCGAVATTGTAAEIADSKLAAAAWTFLDSNATGSTNLKFDTAAAANTNPVNAGLLPPTTGLMANWTIINVVGAAAWSGEAVAVEARDVAGVVATSPTTGVVGERVNRGNVVYWPQTAVAVGTPAINSYSADSLFRDLDVYSIGTTAAITPAAPAAIAAAFYDMPDMSTPYLVTAGGTTAPLLQARTLTNSIATKSVRNEFFTDTGVSASTDWLFSLPTRRYSVAYDYSFDAATAADTATNDGRRFTNINADATFAVTAHFAPLNTKVSSTTNGNGRQICVVLAATSLASYDREESKPGATQIGVVISPSTPNVTPKFNVCGEAAILSINNGGILPTGTGALKASVAVQDTTLLYKDGWATFTTPAAVGALIGLPVLGSSFSRALGNAGGQTFGISSNHRFQR